MDKCNLEPSESCKKFIKEEIKKELKKESDLREEELKNESNLRINFEESVTNQLVNMQNTSEEYKKIALESKKIALESLEISKRNEEAIKTSNTLMMYKLDEIKDLKLAIDTKVNDVSEDIGHMKGKIELVVDFMQNRGRFERLLSWIPRKYRGPTIIILGGGLVAFALMYGQSIVDVIKALKG